MTVSVERAAGVRARERCRAVAAVALLCAAIGGCRKIESPTPLPDGISGTLAVDALSAPVRVVRDRWGIAHIYAANQDDLFVAQGFVQAQDRLFQMDLWRRSALGRLSQVLGPNFAERDAMTRRIQFPGSADDDWRHYGPDARAIASAFVRGINAWIVIARERPPEEFALAGWTPEFWRADDLLVRTDAFAAGGDALEEVLRARLVAAIGAVRAAELLPRFRPTDVPRGLEPAVVGSVVADAIRSVGSPPFFIGLAARLPPAARRAGDAEPRPADVPLDVTRLPAPSPRYLVHLHAPGWNVVGATSPWLPGVADGHNDRVWWLSRAVDVDAQDVFVERVNPGNPHQVDDGGRWIDTELRRDPLVIRRRIQPLIFDRERTRHGAIVAVDRERHLAFTVRAVASEAGAASDLLALSLDRAASLDDVRSALAQWKAPAREMTYGDVDGRRGSEIAALAPIRRGWSGALPAPGWNGANEWTGWRRAVAADPPSPLRLLARRAPGRADALVRDLRQAYASNGGAAGASTIFVAAVAAAVEQLEPADGAVLFAHPLAIDDATRRRFSIGPVRPDVGGARPFAVASDAADWDRSTVVNAPGQSESAASPHYADLVDRWKEGKPVPLAFSDRAVDEAAASTLMLVPAKGSGAR